MDKSNFLAYLTYCAEELLVAYDSNYAIALDKFKDILFLRIESKNSSELKDSVIKIRWTSSDTFGIIDYTTFDSEPDYISQLRRLVMERKTIGEPALITDGYNDVVMGRAYHVSFMDDGENKILNNQLN